MKVDYMILFIFLLWLFFLIFYLNVSIVCIKKYIVIKGMQYSGYYQWKYQSTRIPITLLILIESI